VLWSWLPYCRARRIGLSLSPSRAPAYEGYGDQGDASEHDGEEPEHDEVEHGPLRYPHETVADGGGEKLGYPLKSEVEADGGPEVAGNYTKDAEDHAKGEEEDAPVYGAGGADGGPQTVNSAACARTAIQRAYRAERFR